MLKNYIGMIISLMVCRKSRAVFLYIDASPQTIMYKVLNTPSFSMGCRAILSRFLYIHQQFAWE